MQRETRIIDRHVSRNGSEAEGPSEARGGVVRQRILVLRGCQGRYREQFSGGRSGIGERHVFRHVDRSRAPVRCFAWGHARAGHVFRAHDPAGPKAPKVNAVMAPQPRRFAGVLNRRGLGRFSTLSERQRNIPCCSRLCIRNGYHNHGQIPGRL